MRHGRVFMAGDAAHIHSPAGGQGMNTGLQDAVNLGWKLALVASGRAPSALLDTYQAERGPIAAGVLAFTHAIVRTSTLAPPALAARPAPAAGRRHPRRRALLHDAPSPAVA